MNYMKKNNLSLSRFTTVKIGGIAEVVYFPLGSDGVVEVFKEIKKTEKPFFVLGGGSNVVIQDGKLNYAVIMTSHLTKYVFNLFYYYMFFLIISLKFLQMNLKNNK